MCFETSGGCRLEREPSSYYRQLDGALCDLRSRLLDLKDRGAEIVIFWTTPWGRWNVPSELAKRKFLGLDTRDIEDIDRVEFENNAAPIKGRLTSWPPRSAEDLSIRLIVSLFGSKPSSSDEKRL